MSQTTTKRKNVQLNTTVTPEVFDALKEYRFENRIERMGDVLTLALVRFLDSEGIAVPDADTDSGE